MDSQHRISLQVITGYYWPAIIQSRYSSQCGLNLALGLARTDGCCNESYSPAKIAACFLLQTIISAKQR